MAKKVYMRDFQDRYSSRSLTCLNELTIGWTIERKTYLFANLGLFLFFPLKTRSFSQCSCGELKDIKLEINKLSCSDLPGRILLVVITEVSSPYSTA